MRAKRDPVFDGWAGQPTMPHPPAGWATAFTMFRYAVPELAGFEGRAIYLDTDMVVFGDLAELWRHENKKPWYCTNWKRTDVSVIHCAPFRAAVERGHWPSLAKMKTIAGPHVVRAMLVEHKLMEPGLPSVWNSCDSYEKSATKLLHFTRMETQPWKPWPERFGYGKHKDSGAVKAWEDMYHAAMWKEDAVAITPEAVDTAPGPYAHELQQLPPRPTRDA